MGRAAAAPLGGRRHVPVAPGTDTGGSVRIPAALTGAVGFKPSYGAVSTEGVFRLAQPGSRGDHRRLSRRRRRRLRGISASTLRRRQWPTSLAVRLHWVPSAFGPQDPRVVTMTEARCVLWGGCRWLPRSRRGQVRCS
ncbi:hypothetical protein J4732_11545 [Serratia marcescens]|uniref:Amidase domain-containing protein n=1 Tax=Serratia marcescens TaxID=615 RepID=A0A939NQF1_SERMA|nr:hypothetical protein [Serratia marcescens]